MDDQYAPRGARLGIDAAFWNGVSRPELLILDEDQLCAQVATPSEAEQYWSRVAFSNKASPLSTEVKIMHGPGCGIAC